MARSPKILGISWGRMEVEGIGTGKDFKLYPGGGREWDWDETGTRHSPGIQPADVEELLAHGAEVVVLSLGTYRRLQVGPRTLDFLTARSVAARIAEAREAVRIYNDLADGAQARSCSIRRVNTAGRCRQLSEAGRVAPRSPVREGKEQKEWPPAVRPRAVHLLITRGDQGAASGGRAGGPPASVRCRGRRYHWRR
jgi:hypothetical protein